METSTIGRTQFLLDALGEGVRGLADNPPSAWEAAARFYLVRAILADLRKMMRRRCSVTIDTSIARAYGHAMTAKVEVVNRKEREQRFGWVREDA